MKRLRITPTGKILARGTGKNHFNSRARRRKQLAKNRSVNITTMSNKSKSRFLV